jgi:hypothetical protein
MASGNLKAGRNTIQMDSIELTSFSHANQTKPNQTNDMTIQNKQAMIESARMAIAYEFKSRHSFKGGRYSPRENVRDAVIFVRKTERGVA